MNTYFKVFFQLLKINEKKMKKKSAKNFVGLLPKLYCKVLVVLQYRVGQVGDCIAIQQGCIVARQEVGGRLYRETGLRHGQPRGRAGSAAGARGAADSCGTTRGRAAWA